MFFYEVNVGIKNIDAFLSDMSEDIVAGRDMISDVSDDLSFVAEQVSKEKNNSCFIYLKDLVVRKHSFEVFVRGGAIASEKEEVLHSVKLIEEKSKMIFTDPVIKEVTFSQIAYEANFSGRFGYRHNINEVLRDFDLDRINTDWFEEMLIAERNDREEWFEQQAKRYLCEESLLPELKRIFTKCPVNNRPKGHPVYYMVCVKNKENRRKITELLTEALLANGRLENRRCCIAEYKEQEPFMFQMNGNRKHESLYRISKGGTVVIDYEKEISENGHAARSDEDSAEEICDYIKKYNNDVQTIICLTGESSKTERIFTELDAENGLYGDEAINTIVQEMENNREDVLVIFAGYPDKMKEFLDRNPGLKSRVAFHVPFSDYTGSELYEIAEFIAEEKGVQLHEDVKEKLLPIFEKARLFKDFGNGRFVRNLVEKAKMKQASRLLNGDIDKVTKKDVRLLCADDFEVPAMSIEATERQIGFAV